MELFVGIDDFGALAEPFDDAAAEAGILVAHGRAGGAADGGARLAGGDQRFPRRRRRGLRPRGDDLDLVAVGKFGDQGRDLAVDLAADRHVADIGVHRVGEIDGVRSARQRNQLAFRREAEHLVMEQLELGVLEELLRIGALGEQFDGAAQPRIGAGLARQHLRRRSDTVLVERMRRDSVFRDLVHIPGADLQFDALLARANHRGVNGAIVVLLGRRDVILEATRDHRPGRMHDTERLVALGQALHHHAEPENVGKLLEADGFALHLAPDRIGALAPPRHLGGDAAFGQPARKLLFDFGDQADVFRLERVKPPADHRVRFGIEFAECQILELLAHLVHAHAPGERSVDVERLLGAAPARLGRHVRERAHVVQPVRELDQQHPHVVRDRQQQLAQVLRLLGFLGDEVELFELGEPLDQRADVMTEHLIDLGAGCGRILDGVVQKRGGDGRVVELEIGEDPRHFEGVGKIGVAGGASLLAVRLHGVDVGAIEHRLAGIGIVALHAFDQVILPHHSRRRRLLLFHRFFKYLRDNVKAALQRRSRPGLVLHARQVSGRTRHRYPCRAADHRPASYPKDIITVLNRHKARRLMVTAKTNGPDEAGPRRRRHAAEAVTLLPRAVPRAE